MIDGPSELHQCTVFSFLGPRISIVEALSPHIKLEQKKVAPMLRKLAYQTVKAMKSLHCSEIAHGGEYLVIRLGYEPSSHYYLRRFPSSQPSYSS